MLENESCFSGGGAPTGPRIITESPERIYKQTFIQKYSSHYLCKAKICQLITSQEICLQHMGCYQSQKEAFLPECEWMYFQKENVQVISICAVSIEPGEYFANQATTFAHRQTRINKHKLNEMTRFPDTTRIYLSVCLLFNVRTCLTIPRLGCNC